MFRIIKKLCTWTFLSVMVSSILLVTVSGGCGNEQQFLLPPVLQAPENYAVTSGPPIPGFFWSTIPETATYKFYWKVVDSLAECNELSAEDFEVLSLDDSDLEEISCSELTGGLSGDCTIFAYADGPWSCDDFVCSQVSAVYPAGESSKTGILGLGVNCP